MYVVKNKRNCKVPKCIPWPILLQSYFAQFATYFRAHPSYQIVGEFCGQYGTATRTSVPRHWRQQRRRHCFTQN